MTLQQWLSTKTHDEIRKLCKRWGCSERELTYHINGRHELSYSSTQAIANDAQLDPQQISDEFAARRLANQTKPFSQRPPSVNYFRVPHRPGYQARALCLNCKGYGWTAMATVKKLRHTQNFVFCANCNGKGYIVYDGNESEAELGSTNLDGSSSGGVSEGAKKDEGSNDDA